ncbi:hypothetical protein LAJ19_15260 (plasmid) [Deinococcus taeanensis]|uniref:hypothetical protein n=1 Tax=Deinococcus taeanensis TaxID=2737050 RepID=UPI001CDD1056|nr:hypothetical protein [Deinococcus taeanensis]UBV44162.1 hypothetical protein LAJ19_15260 [Deinococcus taeanensis]
MRRAALILAALTLSTLASAVLPALSAAQVQEAKQEGEAMNTRESGYVVGPYLVKSYNDDLILKPNSPEVDGVVLSTPFERLRYESYLAHLENKPLSDAQAAALARTYAGKLVFRVYSHSPYAVDDELEQWQQAYLTHKVTLTPNREKSYLDFYKPATLTVAGKTYTARPVVDGPYRDNFVLPSGQSDFRNLGVIFYAFDLPALPRSGTVTLSFTDSRGRAYRIQSDAGALR